MPSPGLIWVHINPPASATHAATPSAPDQPICSANQGVRVGDRTPPRLAPVFMRPESAPAWRFDRSTVDDQYAPTGKYSHPAPRDRSAMAAYGDSVKAPNTIDRA